MNAFKKPSDSVNIHTELIMPGQTNPRGNLMGGNLLCWMDVAAAISAMKHAERICVTVSLDNVHFKLPLSVGDLVIMKSFVTRAFNSSMEIVCEVYIKNVKTQEEILSHQAFFTFVCLDDNNKPMTVPGIIPETSEELKLHEGALKRRELRLLLAGKIKPQDANHIKSLFD